VVFGFFYFYFYLWFLKWFLQEMLSYRLCTVNYFNWGFKPILRYSKPYMFSTFLEKKKKKTCIYSLLPVQSHWVVLYSWLQLSDFVFFGVAVWAHFWPTFLYNYVCLGFQKSAVLLDNFISTKSDVWENRENSIFDWMNLIHAKK